MNEQPWLEGDIQNREKLGKILRCSFCRVFNARFEFHLVANRERLRFLWQGKWPVKKHVLGWLVWQQLVGWTCEKRNWRQRDSGLVQGDQSLRQKGKEAECGLSWSTPTVISILGCVQAKTNVIVRIPETTGRIWFAFLKHRKRKWHDGSLQGLYDHSQGSRNRPIYFCVLYCLEARSETNVRRNRAPNEVMSSLSQEMMKQNTWCSCYKGNSRIRPGYLSNTWNSVTLWCLWSQWVWEQCDLQVYCPGVGIPGQKAKENLRPELDSKCWVSKPRAVCIIPPLPQKRTASAPKWPL